MSIQEDIARLANYVPMLAGNDKNFAESLINQFKVKRRLSESQQEWVGKMIQRGIDNFERQEAAKLAPVAPAIPLPVQNVGPLFKRFERAREQYIALPRIQTRLDDPWQTKLTLALPDSSAHIHVRLDGTYLGKITADGKVIPFPADKPMRQDVFDRLCEIAENPSAAGKMHGRKHNNCMFCGRGLLTTDSVHYGYGPICAEKWGLEWGSARERIQEEKEVQAEANFQDAFASVMRTSGFKCDPS